MLGNGAEADRDASASSSGTTPRTRPASSPRPSRRAAPRWHVHLFPDEGPLPAFGGADHIVVLGAVRSVYDPDPLDRRGAGLAARGRPGRRARARHLLRRPDRCAPRSAAGSRPAARKESRLVHRATRPTRTWSRPGPGWSSTATAACCPPAPRSWPATRRPCRPSGSAGTWPSSSTPRSTVPSSSAGWSMAAGGSARGGPGPRRLAGAGLCRGRSLESQG